MKHVHIHIHRTGDATKHDPSNGQFTGGAGGSMHAGRGTPPEPKHKNIPLRERVKEAAKLKASNEKLKKMVPAHRAAEKVRSDYEKAQEAFSKSKSKDCGCGGLKAADSPGASMSAETDPKKRKKGPALEGGPLATGLKPTSK